MARQANAKNVCVCVSLQDSSQSDPRGGTEGLITAYMTGLNQRAKSKQAGATSDI